MRRCSILLVTLYIIILLIGVIIFQGDSPDDSNNLSYTVEALFLRAPSVSYTQNQILGVYDGGNDMGEGDKMSLSASERPCKNKIKAEIKKYDWNTNVAVAVAREESHFDPKAYNPEGHNGCNGSYGIFQISCVHGYSEEEMYDWERNIEIAYKIWKREGWIPWGVCHKPDQKVVCWL